MARVKCELAALGQQLHPQAKLSYVERPANNERSAVILLDRVVKDVTPEYCVHGYVECIRCSALCWLGHETEKAVTSGEANPLCLDCAKLVIPADSTAIKDRTQLRDHRRADGPH